MYLANVKRKFVFLTVTFEVCTLIKFGDSSIQ
jgi:hypothetical protein